MSGPDLSITVNSTPEEIDRFIQTVSEGSNDKTQKTEKQAGKIGDFQSLSTGGKLFKAAAVTLAVAGVAMIIVGAISGSLPLIALGALGLLLGAAALGPPKEDYGLYALLGDKLQQSYTYWKADREGAFDPNTGAFLVKED